MKKIVLLGASGHGKVCGEIAELEGYEEIVFLDDNEELADCGGYPVRGRISDFKMYLQEGADFFVSIGDADIRRRIQEEIVSAGGNTVALVHPKAVVGKSVFMGEGTVVMAGAVINPCAEIGRGCIVNTAATVDHDCVVGNFCHIAVGAHLCGAVNVGEQTWVGAGATVSNNIEICGGCMIGAGAVVIKDIKDAGTYVGVPAEKRNYENFSTYEY